MAVGLVVLAAMCFRFVVARESPSSFVGSPSVTRTNAVSPDDPYSIYFYLVDTTSNVTLLRLRDGDEIDNNFLKGKPVSVCVDTMFEGQAHGMLLIHNKLERYTMERPFVFGGALGDSGLKPLAQQGHVGNHTFTAILLDGHGVSKGNKTITISVLPEPPAHLFMEAPERDAFLQRLQFSVVLNSGPVKHVRGHRLAPLQRRVRLGSLPLLYFRSRMRMV